MRRAAGRQDWDRGAIPRKRCWIGSTNTPSRPHDRERRVGALALGLRQGEVLGLRWQDVDFRKRQLRVQVALQRVGREYKLAEPKTQKGRRTLDLPERVLTALRRRRLIQQQEKLLAGSRWQERWGLVFTTRGGRPLEGPRITRDFEKILVDAELPKQRFHDLRHACASFLLAHSTSSCDGVFGAQPDLADDEHRRARHAHVEASRRSADG